MKREMRPISRMKELLPDRTDSANELREQMRHRRKRLQRVRRDTGAMSLRGSEQTGVVEIQEDFQPRRAQLAGLRGNDAEGPEKRHEMAEKSRGKFTPSDVPKGSVHEIKLPSRGRPNWHCDRVGCRAKSPTERGVKRRGGDINLRVKSLRCKDSLRN